MLTIGIKRHDAEQRIDNNWVLESHAQKTQTPKFNATSKQFGFFSSFYFLLWLLSPLFEKRIRNSILIWTGMHFFFSCFVKGNWSNSIRSSMKRLVFFFLNEHFPLQAIKDGFFIVVVVRKPKPKPKLKNNKRDKNAARGRCLHFESTDRFFRCLSNISPIHCGGQNMITLLPI